MTSEEKISQVLNYLIELRSFAASIDKNFKRDLQANDISICEFLYLLLLDKESYTMIELSSVAKVDKSLTTRVIRDLEKKKYVYRDTDKLSARKYKIKLTDIGVGKVKIIQDILLRERENFIDNFTKEELKLIEESFAIIYNKCIKNK